MFRDLIADPSTLYLLNHFRPKLETILRRKKYTPDARLFVIAFGVHIIHRRASHRNHQVNVLLFCRQPWLGFTQAASLVKEMPLFIDADVVP